MLWAWAIVPTSPPGARGASKEAPRGEEDKGAAACPCAAAAYVRIDGVHVMQLVHQP
jgi:hypothetical protein